MPYKDLSKRNEAVKRFRAKGLQEGITDGVGITRYHPLMYALIDPVKRAKLQSICDALSRRNLQSKVFYGMTPNSIPFDIVEDLLQATDA